MKHFRINGVKLRKVLGPVRYLNHFLKETERLIMRVIHRKKALRFYSQFIREGALCFDVGANVGDRTDIFLRLGAKVVSIEPQQKCIEILNREFGDNPDVTIVATAVGEKEGSGRLAICEDAPTISTLSEKWKSEGRFSKDYRWSSVQEVPITTLDNLIYQYGQPEFLKIDVEGFEEKVIEGLNRPVRFLSFEFTREFFEDTKRSIEHLQSISPARARFNISIGESMKFLFPTWVTLEELYERLGSLKDALLWGDIYVHFS